MCKEGALPGRTEVVHTPLSLSPMINDDQTTSIRVVWLSKCTQPGVGFSKRRTVGSVNQIKKLINTLKKKIVVTYCQTPLVVSGCVLVMWDHRAFMLSFTLSM